MTQCLEGFGNENRTIKQSRIKKIFEKLRNYRNKGTKSSSKIKEEAELSNQAQLIYKEILDTVDRQSPPRKGILRRTHQPVSASLPVSRNNSEASTLPPKGILRNGRKIYPVSEIGGTRREPSSIEISSRVSPTRMRLYHHLEGERRPEAKNRFQRPEYSTGYPGPR